MLSDKLFNGTKFIKFHPKTDDIALLQEVDGNYWIGEFDSYIARNLCSFEIPFVWVCSGGEDLDQSILILNSIRP